MAAGKLTIQAWYEEKEREEAARQERQAQLERLGRLIEEFPGGRRRRRLSVLDRFFEFLVG